MGKMKLIGGITLLSAITYASAACSDNVKRGTCRRDADDCQWLRHGIKGGGGHCKNTADVQCHDIKKSETLCNQYSCHYNAIDKSCDVSAPMCEQLLSKKACKALGNCFWSKKYPGPPCNELARKDECDYFISWKWGCNKVANNCEYKDGFCVVGTGSGSGSGGSTGGSKKKGGIGDKCTSNPDCKTNKCFNSLMCI